MDEIVMCVSCDGYGWISDDETGEAVDCDWCNGVGYVYRDANGHDRKIPDADYGRVAAILEDLEAKRLKDMGYTGTAKRPDRKK